MVEPEKIVYTLAEVIKHMCVHLDACILRTCMNVYLQTCVCAAVSVLILWYLCCVCVCVCMSGTLSNDHQHIYCTVDLNNIETETDITLILNLE